MSSALWSEAAEIFIHHLREKRVAVPSLELQFCEWREWRFDFAWIQDKVFAELEGFAPRKAGGMGRHQRPEGFQRDMDKYNAAALLGWRGFRFSSTDLLTGVGAEVIRIALSSRLAIAQIQAPVFRDELLVNLPAILPAYFDPRRDPRKRS